MLAAIKFRLYQFIGEVLVWAVIDPNSLPILLAFVLSLHLLVMLLWLRQNGRL